MEFSTDDYHRDSGLLRENREETRAWNSTAKGKERDDRRSSVSGRWRRSRLVENVDDFLPLCSIFLPDDDVVSSVVVDLIGAAEREREDDSIILH